MKRIIIITGFIIVGILSGGLFGLSLFDRYFPHGRMWETPVIRPHETILPVTQDTSIPFSGGEAQYRAVHGNQLASSLGKATPVQIEAGQELYLTYCVQCHGKKYDGNGSVGQSFYPLPADLKSESVQTMTEGLLFQRISYGNPPEGRQPPLASTIEINDRWKIVAFIRTLDKSTGDGP